MKQFKCTEQEPVVRTKAGLVRGYQYDCTFIFKGIPYAKANRFMRPVEVTPWEGIKDTQSHGMVCPLLSTGYPNGELLVPHCPWVEKQQLFWRHISLVRQRVRRQ